MLKKLISQNIKNSLCDDQNIEDCPILYLYTCNTGQF